MSELVERLEPVWVQNLRSFIRDQAGFGDEWRDIFVERLDATIADNASLQEALAAAEAEIERLLPIESEAEEGREINGELRALIAAKDEALTGVYEWATDERIPLRVQEIAMIKRALTLTSDPLPALLEEARK